MAAKRQRTRREISLFSKNKKNYESYTEDIKNPDEAHDEYLLQNKEIIRGKL